VTNTTRGRNSYQVVVLGGLVAGTLDLTAACIYSWLRASVAPVRVMQSIAAGLLGAASYTGGPKTAALGVALHFLIATVATAIFYIVSRKVEFLTRQSILAGLIYGLAVYLFMNFVVLPLSELPRRGAPPLSARIIGLLIIMFCVGLPISTIVRRFAR
jgi:uncharacterized membrane protein YagU involved in acid resistance